MYVNTHTRSWDRFRLVVRPCPFETENEDRLLFFNNCSLRRFYFVNFFFAAVAIKCCQLLLPTRLNTITLYVEIRYSPAAAAVDTLIKRNTCWLRGRGEPLGNCRRPRREFWRGNRLQDTHTCDSVIHGWQGRTSTVIIIFSISIVDVRRSRRFPATNNAVLV